jgi:hypothetical protein
VPITCFLIKWKMGLPKECLQMATLRVTRFVAEVRDTGTRAGL